MLKKIIASLNLLLITTIVFSQQIDTALVLKHLKIRLLSELDLGLMKESTLNAFLNKDLKVDILKTKGFENIIFFKISSQILAIDTIKESKKIIEYKTPLCLNNGEECFFVFGFNKINNMFYRLKGTKGNDFSILYSNLEQWQYWKTPSKINKSLIRKFVEDYWIEGVDLNCLLRSLKKDSGKCLEYFSPKLIVY